MNEESHTITSKDFEYNVIPKFINAIKMVPKAQPQSAEKQKSVYTVNIFNMECKGLIW